MTKFLSVTKTSESRHSHVYKNEGESAVVVVERVCSCFETCQKGEEGHRNGDRRKKRLTVTREGFGPRKVTLEEEGTP